MGLGLGLTSVTPDARRTYNLADSINGVVITKVDPSSDAADKGLQPGDVLLKIGSVTVKTPKFGIVETSCDDDAYSGRPFGENDVVLPEVGAHAHL